MCARAHVLEEGVRAGRSLAPHLLVILLNTKEVSSGLSDLPRCQGADADPRTPGDEEVNLGPEFGAPISGAHLSLRHRATTFLRGL